MTSDTKIKVVTRNCIHCAKPGYVEMTREQFETGKARIEQGAHYKDAFPFLHLSLVEMFISGTHPECWNKLFPPEEDD